MELKPGYKQTEIGIVPDDWYVKRLREIVLKVIDNRGKTPPFSNQGDHELIESASISFVNQSPDYSKVSKYVSGNVYKYWFRDHPILDDILISTVGEYSGASALMKESRGTVAQNIVALRIEDAFPSYIFYWSRSKIFRNQLDQVKMNQAQPSLRVPWLLNFYVCLPTDKLEQTAIAQALSDTDELISSLDKLITKKRNIKQGAMQQLLTGKKRLPGFTGEWKTKKLGEIAEIKDGTHQTPHYVEIGIPFYSVENVTQDNFTNTKHISLEEHKFLTKSYKIERGDLLMTRIGSVGDCKLIDWEVEASFYVSLALLKIKPQYFNKFVLHFTKSKEFQKEAELRSLLWAVPKKINLGAISDINITIPMDKEEQIAIAQILSDMDSEIENLEKKRDKYKAIKQGMMQELLTGKTRLI